MEIRKLRIWGFEWGYFMEIRKLSIWGFEWVLMRIWVRGSRVFNGNLPSGMLAGNLPSAMLDGNRG